MGGWHSFPNHSNYVLNEAFKFYNVEDRKVPYTIQWNEPERKVKAANYFRENPHRLHLGSLGLELINSDKSKVSALSIKNINQQLNLWEGKIQSVFEVENEVVEVGTFSHPEKDKIIYRDKIRKIKKWIDRSKT